MPPSHRPAATSRPSEGPPSGPRRAWIAAFGSVALLPAWAQGVPADTRPLIEWPDLQLLDGGSWDSASWQGRPAIVVFWATYCAYCLRHNAHIERLHRQGHPLRVLGVALDSDGSAVRRYLQSHGYSFPVVADGSRLRARITTRRVIPMTALLDRQGRLLQAIPGEMAADDVMGLAPALLRPRS